MTDRVVIGKREEGDVGLWVSKATQDVMDVGEGGTAYGSNLTFSTTDPIAVMHVVQTGTFQIQCKKTYMGKKGSLELNSDEQARTNTTYTEYYSFQTETADDETFYADSPVNSNAAHLGFDQGQTPHTGNGFVPQHVQNVYCDYGTELIEFYPPLPKHIKNPHVSVFFALANSSGHFHPWYANVTCTPGNEDYGWQYANSQHCVHMDSAWFRGKWSFRERTIAPFGDHYVNTNYPYAVRDKSSPEKEAVGEGGLENISFNVNADDPNSPASLWGGTFKSFAGLQGITYFANNSHLRVDAFLTPTHTPTPFETEIVKSRRKNTLESSGANYDYYSAGNPAAWPNGWFDGEGNFSGSGAAYAKNYGFPYVIRGGETKFRTVYWEGNHANTEFEWFARGYDPQGEKTVFENIGSHNKEVTNYGTRFPNQLPDTATGNFPPNSQYEPGDAFLKTRTFQGQPTSLDSFWNSFSNNTSQWVSSNTPYGEFYYADGGYVMDLSKKVNDVDDYDNIPLKQSFTKHNWHGGNPKAGVGTEGRRFGFGGAGSAEALGGEGEGVFDTYIGRYIIYDIEGHGGEDY